MPALARVALRLSRLRLSFLSLRLIGHSWTYLPFGRRPSRYSMLAGARRTERSNRSLRRPF